jgi:UDP-N-acetyl-D-glucosamine dehydrogenase
VRPLLEKTGLIAGQDFFLCFSPERVDPGNPTYQTANIPKVVGGVTAECTQIGKLFYSQEWRLPKAV